MSDNNCNIFEPLMNSLFDVGRVTFKHILKALGMRFNKYDFEQFFKGANVGNNSGVVPKFLKWSSEEDYDSYYFNIPPGVEVKDLRKEISALAIFIGVDESLLDFRLAENMKDVELRVFEKRNVQKYNFYDYFSASELKNSREDYPRLKNYSDEKFYEKYVFSVPTSISVNDFRKHLSALALFLKIKEEKLRFEVNENFEDVELRILKEFEEVDFSMIDMNRNFDKNDFRIPIGIDISKNEFAYWNMIDDLSWHLYIAGTTGCGKTNIIRIILTFLIATKTDADVEFCVFNTKKVDMQIFKNVKHIKNFVYGKENSLEMMEHLVLEMKTRYEVLERNNFDDWNELRKVRRLPYKVVVIEELAEYKGFNKWHNYLELLLTQGRGAGIFVIVTTQLPSIENMSSLSKQCFNTTIAMKCKDTIRASIVIDDENANLDKLKEKGHLKLYDCKNYGLEVQSFKINKKQILEMSKVNKVKSS